METSPLDCASFYLAITGEANFLSLFFLNEYILVRMSILSPWAPPVRQLAIPGWYTDTPTF